MVDKRTLDESQMVWLENDASISITLISYSNTIHMSVVCNCLDYNRSDTEFDGIVAPIVSHYISSFVNCFDMVSYGDQTFHYK